MALLVRECILGSAHSETIWGLYRWYHDMGENQLVVAKYELQKNHFVTFLCGFFHEVVELFWNIFDADAANVQFKPNSITLAGSKLVQSWSQTCSELKFGLSSSLLAAN